MEEISDRRSLRAFFLSFELVNNSKVVTNILLTFRAREKTIKRFKLTFLFSCFAKHETDSECIYAVTMLVKCLVK